MMECSVCSAENAKNAKFCKACGASLGGGSKEIALVTEQLNTERYVIKDRFKIIKKLGKGGMGEVLLAEDVKLGRKVAIKSILRTSLTDTTSKIRFLREAQTASQLDHTNICTIYEIYEEDERDYIVMQYIDGVTLDQIIGVKKLSVDKIVDISIQVCNGMIEAHNKEIIHRDIKPSNIMIDNKGVVTILDFGLAKFTSESAVKKDGMVDSDLTQKGFVMGTVAYISPEQAKGKPLDKRTDIFSFGVVLYEMIEARNPFRVEEQIETLYNVLNKKVEFTRDIPEEFKEIIKKALEKDRDDRYQDFASLKEELQAFQKFYARLKARNAETKVTEVIDLTEKAQILEEVQKTSDKENLGEMVDRIKKMKASTERVEPTQRRKLRFLWALPILVLFIIAAYFLVIKSKDTGPLVKRGETFYIYLHPFENNTGEESLPEMLDYLLLESLNQFDEFKTIDKDLAMSLLTKEIEAVDFQLLKSKFNINIEFELSGKVSKERSFYTVDARLTPVDKEKSSKSYPLTTTGKSRDSLLSIQVDTLTRQAYDHLFAFQQSDLQMKKIARIFGSKWEDFSNFYAGFLFHKKLELAKAEYHLKKSQDLLISKYYLADLYYFRGRRKEAATIIEEMIPDIGELPPTLQLKVRAIRARLIYDYNKEIEYWTQLKDRIPYSKEVFFELGEAHFHHANPQEAIKSYEEALRLDPRYSQALNHMGYCYSYLGDHKKAIQFFLNYRTLDATANSFDSLGDGYFFAGDLENAITYKERAVVPDENGNRLSYPYQTLADIYILRDQYEKANQELNNYLELETADSNRAGVLSTRAFIHFKDRQYSPALELIEQSLQTHDSRDIKDNTAEAHWLKGLILLALDNVEESKKELQWLNDFKEKYHLDKDNFHEAFKYLIHLEALIFEKENQLDKSDQRFKLLIHDMKHKLSYWTTYFNYQFFHSEYVKFLTRNQRDGEVLEELNRCLEFSDKYIPALWHKAQILEKSNEPEEAKSIYEKITELYGESDEENYHRNLLKDKLNQLQIQ
ncbi:MAG: protein kinase [Candidatus Aminicenantes bacterium]|jgi:serine/threonine protein kinase